MHKLLKKSFQNKNKKKYNEKLMNSLIYPCIVNFGWYIYKKRFDLLIIFHAGCLPVPF